MRIEVDRKEGFEYVDVVEYVGKIKKVRREKVRVVTRLVVDIDALKERISKIREETGKNVDAILEELGWGKYKEKIKVHLKME